MSMKINRARGRDDLHIEIFKSGVVSMLYSLFSARKKQAASRGKKYLMQTLADESGVNKSQLSRWFNGDSTPNWRMSTLFELCEAMDGELRVSVVDRHTGLVHTPAGVEKVGTPARSCPTTINYMVVDFSVFQDRGSNIHTVTKCRFTQSSATIDGRQLESPVFALVGGPREGAA